MTNMKVCYMVPTCYFYRMASEGYMEKCQSAAGECPEPVNNHTKSRMEALKKQLAKVCPQECEYCKKFSQYETNTYFKAICV